MSCLGAIKNAGITWCEMSWKTSALKWVYRKDDKWNISGGVDVFRLRTNWLICDYHQLLGVTWWLDGGNYFYRNLPLPEPICWCLFVSGGIQIKMRLILWSNYSLIHVQCTYTVHHQSNFFHKFSLRTSNWPTSISLKVSSKELELLILVVVRYQAMRWWGSADSVLWTINLINSGK